ncbi:MAG: serine hydrolase, partial [Oscillospiraceae bacterium]|nr:serine hydrolase [Oscillospiraceae bacterium]
MKLLKTALSAAIVLCLLLSVLPAASALEADERFDGKTWLEVVEDFNERLSIRPQNVTYGYRNTVTGEEHFYNGDTYMVSGSMYKVPLNMVVAEEVYNGEIDWDTQFGGYTYRKLQEGSIIHSDNDYARILWQHVGNGAYRTYRRVIAPLMGEDPDTVDPKFYENNFTTSRQMICCLSELYTNSERYPGVIDCMKLAEPHEYFRRSENRFEIAHKYGFLEDNAGLHMNDCAIVWTDEPILIVCFTTGQFNAYDVLAQYCTLMCDYAQYTTAHHEAAEGALDAALADLALPAFARQQEEALPEPEATPEPTPEPV